MQGASGRVIYFNPDESVRASRRDASAMLRDLSISKPLEERVDATALLEWQIEPENKEDLSQVQFAEEVTAMIEEIPNFLEYRRSLLGAVFHGRWAVSQSFNWDWRSDSRQFLKISGWEPVHGDKLVFDTDGNVGLRIG